MGESLFALHNLLKQLKWVTGDSLDVPRKTGNEAISHRKKNLVNGCEDQKWRLKGWFREPVMNLPPDNTHGRAESAEERGKEKLGTNDPRNVGVRKGSRVLLANSRLRDFG